MLDPPDLAETDPMHVLIDAHVFQPGGRGMSHFAEEFVHGLAEQARDVRVTVLSRFPERMPATDLLRAVKIPDVSPPVWEQALLPFFIRRHRPDVVHSLANTSPVVWPSRAARVVTLHDVMWLHPDPEISAGETLVQKVGKVYRTWICRLTIPRARCVFTVSEYSKGEIEKVFPSQRGRVQVVRQGPGLKPPAAAPPAPERPYVVLPTGNHPRKNARRAIEAFLRFRRETGAPWELRVFGVRKEQLDVAGLDADEVERGVRVLGYVPDAELPGLIAAAELVFFPSLYEGLGLPVLDAITLGRPVLTSNVASLPWVAGPGGLLVDPYAVDAMAAALARLWGEPALRAELAARGLEHAATFGWDRTAAQTLAAYREILGEPASQRRTVV